ncbi:SRPBCC family protein [Dactylosporangium sp. AC04546]|uniref:SRPBCC family protein n=1 Tax=Dactylosporangium sp. AC04546 TaxID=2862460 RepID=UPI001EE02335|nr:SRPBCC family protein [Dactylosporangium sp. AC04546]WVK79415.1 SRPBCC family protein [Dactylosporangium sp. AC04546]
MKWENTITIDAPAGVVWALTVDVERWPDATPTMTSVVRLDDGPLRTGSRARIKQPAQSAAVWTVTRLVEGREFAWQTRRMGLTMTGSHLVEPTGDDRCRNTLGIEIHGRGAGLFGLLFGGVLRRAIVTENLGFRSAAQGAPDRQP